MLLGMAIQFFLEAGRGHRPRVSIRRQGQIGLNQGAVRRFSVGECTHAILGYDKGTRCAAIKLTSDGDERGAQKIVFKDGSATISARGFLEFFDIPYRDRTRQFDVRKDSESGYLLFDITDEEMNSDAEGTSPTDSA